MDATQPVDPAFASDTRPGLPIASNEDSRRAPGAMHLDTRPPRTCLSPKNTYEEEAHHE